MTAPTTENCIFIARRRRASGPFPAWWQCALHLPGKAIAFTLENRSKQPPTLEAALHILDNATIYGAHPIPSVLS